MDAAVQYCSYTRYNAYTLIKVSVLIRDSFRSIAIVKNVLKIFSQTLVTVKVGLVIRIA